MRLVRRTVSTPELTPYVERETHEHRGVEHVVQPSREQIRQCLRPAAIWNVRHLKPGRGAGEHLGARRWMLCCTGRTGSLS